VSSLYLKDYSTFAQSSNDSLYDLIDDFRKMDLASTVATTTNTAATTTAATATPTTTAISSNSSSGADQTIRLWKQINRIRQAPMTSINKAKQPYYDTAADSDGGNGDYYYDENEDDYEEQQSKQHERVERRLKVEDRYRDEIKDVERSLRLATQQRRK
jgi:hypothetical protein